MNPLVAQFAPAPVGTALLVGDFGSAAPFGHFASAFRASGWHVAELEMGPLLGAPGNRWVNAAFDRLLPRAKVAGLARAIATQASVNNADVVLFAKGMGATPALLDELHGAGIRTINWYPDYHFTHPFVDQQCLAQFDLFVTTKAFHLPYLAAIRGEKPTILVEHGFCPNVHQRAVPAIAPIDRPFDCVFIGNHSPYKEVMLRDIIAQSPAATRFAIVGERWEGTPPGPAPYTVVSRALTGDMMARAVSNARIAIALHHGPATDNSGWQDDVSARTFEIPACGTFMLHIDNDHVRTLFDAPREIGLFTTATEAAERIGHYLMHADEREAMAARAYARTSAEFSYVDRGIAIADAASALLQDRPLP